jgi:predicted metal-dependent hydrolase
MLFIGFVFIFIIIIIFIICRIKYPKDNLVYEKATFDDEYYWVRNERDKSAGANTLALIKQNMVKLIKYLNKNEKTFPDYVTYITDLIRRTKIIYIMETPSDENYTSYTVNKGEKIVFCIREKMFKNIHDINVIMYVVLHEMAHIACPEIGHTDLFRKIFKFLLVEAQKINIYIFINYRINPANYCGMTITENLFE